MEFSHKLRELKYPNLIIGLTGDALEEDQKEFLKAGADFVIIKPLKLDLLECLIKYCNSNGFNCTGKKKLKVKRNGNIDT